MFKKRFVAFLVFFLITSAGAGGYLQIQSVRNTWQKWSAQITGMEFKSTVEGFLARNEMTVSIKDILSNSYPNDSLEAVLNFDLPENSVIDSMYLLIKGVFEPAYMKCAWNATMIYENIVKRRIDPALLKRNGNSNNYTIQIFPFLQREERTIKICYTTVLSRSFCKLSLAVPLEISSLSVYPTETLVSKSTIKNIKPAAISCIHGSGTHTITANSPNGSTVSFEDKNTRHTIPLLIIINSSSPADRGVTVNFLKDIGGETFFAALLDPGQMFKTEKNNRKKICIIWNNVTPDYSNNFNYYYNTLVENDKNDILSFVKQTLKTGDSINLIINDHSVSSFKKKLTLFSEQTCSELSAFLSDSLNTTSKYSGCQSPLDALTEGFKSISASDSSWIIVIDRSNITMPYDSTKATQLAANLQKLLPKTKQFFWCLQPGPKNLISAVYTGIRKVNPGVLYTFSAYNSALYPLLESMKPCFSEKMYPASITFSDPNTRFPYDIVGPTVDCLYSRWQYVFFGKLYNSKRLKLSCNGIYNGREYSFDSIYAVKNAPSSIPTLSDCWAQQKADRLLAPANPPVNDKKQALNISLQYRILTSLTALLALEKWMADSLKMADDKPSSSDTLFVTKPDNGNPTDIDVIIAPPKTKGRPFSVVFVNSRLSMYIPARYTGQNLPVTLKLFDLNGRCIADLTNELKRSNGSIIFDASNLKSGVYIVRLYTGKKSITRQCIVTR